MIKIMLSLVLALLFQTAHAATWNVSADRTSVANAVSSASSGDTINVASGTQTWSSAIAIPAAKNLAIIGAGIGNTNITCSSGTCFQIGYGNSTNGASSASRVSGFTFNNGIVQTDGLDTNKYFRIDHCRFTSSNMEWSVNGYGNSNPPNGLFDHNQFVGVRFIIGGTNFAGGSETLYQSGVWYMNPNFGGLDAVYFEDNTFTVTTNPQPWDGNYGARAVFRYNTVNLASIYFMEWHGMQGTNRAPQRFEVYNNTFNNAAWVNIDWRGGSGLFFNNTQTGDMKPVLMELERACISVPTSGLCDGSKIYDGNRSGQSGYPCRDQIGRGRDKTLLTNLSNPWPEQELWPIYGWNNFNGSTRVPLTPQSDCAAETAKVVANRDFYDGATGVQTAKGTPFNGTSGVGWGTLARRPDTCTPTAQAADAGFGGVGYFATDVGAQGTLYRCSATNTWTVHYTPYEYPHPLVSDAPDTTAPTVTTASVNGSTATINFNESVVSTNYVSGDFNLDCTNPTASNIALSSPSGSGDSRTFSVATPIVYGQTCNLDYTGSNGIRDDALNYMVAQDNIEISNTTPDTTAPTVSGALPTGEQECTSDPRNVTASVTTSENATCRYGWTSVPFGSMANFSTTGGTSHSTILSGLSCGSSYTLYVLCADSSANISSPVTTINLSIASQYAPRGITGTGIIKMGSIH